SRGFLRRRSGLLLAGCLGLGSRLARGDLLFQRLTLGSSTGTCSRFLGCSALFCDTLLLSGLGLGGSFLCSGFGFHCGLLGSDLAFQLLFLDTGGFLGGI